MNCIICKEVIEEDTEEWVKLTDFLGNVQTGETHHHLECWKERFQITNSERKKKMYKQAMMAVSNIVKSVKQKDGEE